MDYLTKDDIIIINERTVKRHGGNFVPPFNLLNESPLDYLVDAVSAEMFGAPLYPEIHDKAAVYMFNIITNHIFQDGNKRTGLGASIFFVERNNWKLKERFNEENPSDNTLYHFTIKVASGELTLEECQAWFKENIEPLK